MHFYDRQFPYIGEQWVYVYTVRQIASITVTLTYWKDDILPTNRRSNTTVSKHWVEPFFSRHSLVTNGLQLSTIASFIMLGEMFAF